MEEKKIGKIQGRIRGEGMFSISRYNKLPSTFISNMTILACMVVGINLAIFVILQRVEGKKIGQIQGRINRRSLVLNPTIQVITNLHTKYNYSSLHGYGKSLTKNFILQSRQERNFDKYREELVGEGWFSIPRYNKSSSTCLPNMIF